MNCNGLKVSCRINAKRIRDTFLLLEADINDPDQFNEEECFRFYNQVSHGEKLGFLAEFLRSDQTTIDTHLPYNVKIFQEHVRSFFYLLIQILGHNDDTMVDEVMLGCIFKSSKLMSHKHLKFDEFLAEKVHSQLEIFTRKRISGISHCFYSWLYATI